MKKLLTTTLLFAAALFAANAQAPQNAPDVMLQGFYYDSYNETNARNANGDFYGTTKWTDLSSQAAEIAATFSMVWLPPSAASEGGTGYHPKQWSNQSSDWGTKAALKQLISNLNSNGASSNPTGHCYASADIVINHKAGNYGWVDLCNENFGDYGSFTLYESTSTSKYICSDDEAASNGYTCNGAKDAGYDTQCNASGGYCASRDLDHSNSYLRDAIKAYLKWMKGEIGYNGWRYDLVKGYLGKYNQEYNNAAGAYYSVGEYWDGSYDALKYWINETGKTSTAFDFCMKYNALNNSLAANNYQGMAGYGTVVGLAGNDEMKRYATTFVDNHDTFRDHNKFGGDWTKANAYIISAPGIPCVFYPHWVRCKEAIKKMIAARYACGIHSQSACSTDGTCGSYYMCTTTGTKGKLICFIGGGWSAPSGFTLACSGDGWAYYTNVTVPTGPVVTMTPAGGYVGQGGTVTLTTTKGTIYYTTDGTTPSASSTQYSSPISITVNNTTIKAIAIDGSTKSDIVSGTFLTEKPAGLTVQFKAPSSWSTVALYVWDANENKILGEWPGKVISKSGDYYTYTITESDIRPLNIIFNDNNNGHQTVDLSASADACWDGSSGTSAKITPTSCGETPTPGESVTVALAQYSQWTTVALYAWDDSGALLGEWPGETLTLSGGYYSKTISSYTGTLYIIFNNGNNKEQTQNITVSGSTCYEINTSDKGTDSYGNTTYGVNTSTSCITDVEEQEAGSNGVVLYPNPTTGELNISGGEFVKATVTNLAGQSFKYSVSGGSLNVSNLAKGLYIIDLESASGDVAKGKFIKK